MTDYLDRWQYRWNAITPSPLDVEIIDTFFADNNNEKYLKRVLTNLLESTTSDDIKIKKIFKFVANEITHNLVFQPLNLSENIPSKSSTSLVLKNGRCGVKARVLADLLCLAKFDSGIVLTGHHVVTYLKLENNCIILDSDILSPTALDALSLIEFPTLEKYLVQDIKLDELENHAHFCHPSNQMAILDSELAIKTKVSSSLNSKTGQLFFYSRKNYIDESILTVNVNPKSPLHFL